jgi:hypothetical protein
MPKIVLPNSLARLVGREPAVYEITRRIKRTAESILENERLTADLDDEAAKELLNWAAATQPDPEDLACDWEADE